jgi:hypothetical protein
MRATHRFSVMSIVNCPPPPHHFIIRSRASVHVSSLSPRFAGANEMSHANVRLEMPICREVLIVSGWRHIVCEAQAVVGCSEVHVQESLISTIKRYPPFRHGEQRIIIAHVRVEDHQAGIEDVRPADIRSCRECVRQIEQLIWSAYGDHVGIYVYDPPKLYLSP